MNEMQGLAVFPTDTVYGLGCSAHWQVGLKRIYALKGRPEEKPLPILLAAVPDREAFSDLGERIDTLARGVWPGKTTLILPLKDCLRKWLGIDWDADTIGIRVSSHPAVHAVTEQLGSPLAVTSANLSGGPESHSLSEIPENIKESADILIDGGILPPSHPSTVLDCSVWPPKVLRQGAMPKREIQNIIRFCES